VSPADETLSLEVGEVLMHRRERVKPELAGDFLEARGVPVSVDMLGNEVEDFALATC
jgi:hypothetical protein